MLETTNREALSAFLEIARRWQLSRGQQALLLGLHSAGFEDLIGQTDAASLTDETLVRLAYLVRIDAGLQLLLPIPERADAWIHQPNAAPIFAGALALSHMLRGRLSDLRDVADHLATFLSGDFS